MDPLHIPKEGQLLVGPLFNEPMLVETVRPGGVAVWTAGLVGNRTHQFRRVQLSENDLGLLRIVETSRSFDGDPQLLKLAVQAYALGIAYEFDPYFGLSISRVDPLPHQLEAVYDRLLKVPRVRFLLADDAGAGKTIMAGLLLRELKLRGLCDRIQCGSARYNCSARPVRDSLPTRSKRSRGVRNRWTCSLPPERWMLRFRTSRPSAGARRPA
jgi:hypothetical protein